jgi:hypothetical protein
MNGMRDWKDMRENERGMRRGMRGGINKRNDKRNEKEVENCGCEGCQSWGKWSHRIVHLQKL